jgi:2-polyprenyl-3-methyl-5-hydroxy-6-metoxy-1,4-benzoquinol methylase
MAEAYRDFDREAAAWDEKPLRVKLADEVVRAVVETAHPGPDMEALDFGCGTGLVALRLAPLVRRMTGADGSEGMLGVFQAKAKAQGLENVQARLVALDREPDLGGPYDLVVSSMTLHHVRDAAALVGCLARAVRPGGFLCLADLEPEDGSFHSDNTGVFHFGLDRDMVVGLLEQGGCADVGYRAAAMVEKARPEGMRAYPVFLAWGRRVQTARPGLPK